jgi:hypothetical protein
MSVAEYEAVFMTTTSSGGWVRPHQEETSPFHSVMGMFSQRRSLTGVRRHTRSVVSHAVSMMPATAAWPQALLSTQYGRQLN